MTIFLVKIHKKIWAILDVDSPWIRITLRAEKALRVIFVINFYNFLTSHLELDLHARGKPSTWFPRGRLVETENP